MIQVRCHQFSCRYVVLTPPSFNSPAVTSFSLPLEHSLQSPPLDCRNGGIRLPNTPLSDIASLLSVPGSPCKAATSLDYSLAPRFNEESRKPSVLQLIHTVPNRPKPRIGQTKDSTLTMTDYGAGVRRLVPASHLVWNSSQTPSTSTREQASYDQLSTNSRVTGATAKTQTHHLTQHPDEWYHVTVASPCTRGSSDSSSCAEAFYPQSPTHLGSHVTRTTVPDR